MPDRPERAARLILGIDPSLTATGLTVLDVTDPQPTVRAHMVVRSGPRHPFEVRLQRIHDEVCRMWRGVSEVVIEDPTTFKNRWPSNLRSSVSIGRLGAAFGAAVAACPYDVHVVSQDWIPRGVAHKQFRHHLKARYPALDSLPDDCVFAAGVALYWLDQQTPARQRLEVLRG